MSTDAPPASVSALTVIGIASAAALVPLNSTMIAVALPSIADAFEVSTAEVSVLITFYLVCMLVGQPIAGRVADRFGSRRTVLVALIGLAVFSGLAAFATAFRFLIVARVLQAICAAALSPSAQSLLRSASPAAEQGRVFGIFGSVLATGAAAGPVVGGMLLALFDWRAIFIVNVPIALFAAAASRAVRQPARAAQKGSSERGGTPAGRIANRVFVAGFSAQAFTTQAQYTLVFLTPIVLHARGWGPGTIGLALAALTLGNIVTGPWGGRLGDTRGHRWPATLGIAVAGIGITSLAVMGRDVEPVILIPALAIFGLGLGAALPNLMSAALTSVPERRTGTAAGVLSMSRYVGSITTSILIAVLVTEDGSGARSVLAVAVVCMLAALAMARLLPTRRPHPGSSSVSGIAWPTVATGDNASQEPKA